MIDKDIIRDNFSKYAPYYDRYASVQNVCAAKLIAKVNRYNITRILDVGCGTGNYTKMLRDKFPNAYIEAIDISGKMVEIARKKMKDSINFIVADAESIELSGTFDLISSNATFQWFDNIEHTLLKFRSHLRQDGTILFSIFSRDTFSELSESLKEIKGQNASLCSGNFIGMEKIKNLLEKIFRETQVERYVHIEKYNSIRELLKKIKYSGIRGNGLEHKGCWTARMISNLERIYIKKYKTILATYEILFCKAVK